MEFYDMAKNGGVRRGLKKSKPTFEFEQLIATDHGWPIAGVDEAGRGPLAGPVVAAAVVIDQATVEDGLPLELDALNDSKVLKESIREELHDFIRAHFDVGVGVGDIERIDRDNILNATMWAMQTAVAELRGQPAAVLIDGNRSPALDCPSRSVVKGDARCLSIAAASVVAKVTRDRLMRKLGAMHPEYGFESHKGYGTRAHVEAVRKYGVLSSHRRSFGPIKLALRGGQEDDGCVS